MSGLNLAPPLYSGGPAGKVFGQSGRSGAGYAWGSPFADMASLVMPHSHVEAMRWCEAITYGNGELREGMERVLAYFITEITVSDCSDAEKKRYEKFLKEIGIKEILAEAGLNYLIYGNAFLSVIPPFRRNLVCTKCSSEISIKEATSNSKVNFKFEAFRFNGTCTRCKHRGPMRVKDRKGESKEITVKIWDPNTIEVRHDMHSNRCEYLWKIPDDYRMQVMRGNRLHVENADVDVLKAMREAKYFEFERDSFFHLKEKTPAGIKMRGWGISRLISNFRQAWHVQVLKRYNEAIALDFIMPFRVISPPPATGAGGDITSPTLTGSGARFRQEMNKILAIRRRDPAAIHVSPYALNYQALGGEARQLAPKDLLDSAQEILLNNFGIPYELFKGTLQLQAAPVALRVFESHWSHLVHALNRILRFLARRIHETLGWELVTKELDRVSIADDI